MADAALPSSLSQILQELVARRYGQEGDDQVTGWRGLLKEEDEEDKRRGGNRHGLISSYLAAARDIKAYEVSTEMMMM